MSSGRVAIVGAGISGLTTAYLLKQRRPEWQVAVFERDPQPGGKVRSSVSGGYTFDWGPNGFITNAPETLELARALGLEDRLLPASELAKRRFIFQDGGLRPLPMSPPALVASDLLRPGQKLRALGDLWARPHDGEETVHAFAARHFGRGVAEVLAGPMVLGVSAGDARETSLDALFPALRRLERGHGSLLRAMIRARRGAQAAGGARGRLTSFSGGGTQVLVDALRAALAGALETDSGVTRLRAEAGGFELELERGEPRRADAVVLATPAFVSAGLLAPLAPQAAQELAGIPYAGVSVFGLGYDRIDVPNALDGFGFLVPRGEGLRVLGVLYSSSVFPEQAPAGKVLMRVICGGAVDPEFMTLEPDEALAVVRRDLERSLGVTAPPERLERVSWPRAIPQYLLGHRERVAGALAALPPGLHLVGNAYHGVGLNDCVRDAGRVAGSLVADRVEG